MVIIVDAKCVMNDNDDGDDDNYNDDVIEFDAKCQNTITGSSLILIKEKKFDSKKKKKRYKLRTALPKSVAS